MPTVIVSPTIKVPNMFLINKGLPEDAEFYLVTVASCTRSWSCYDLQN